jgi:hypothetical protein
VEGYKSSDAMKESGIVWTDETVAAYVTDPKGFVPGNKMAFAGLKEDDEIQDLLAYLHEATGSWRSGRPPPHEHRPVGEGEKEESRGPQQAAPQEDSLRRRGRSRHAQQRARGHGRIDRHGDRPGGQRPAGYGRGSLRS